MGNAQAVVTWRTDCTDWADRLKAGQSIIPPPIFPEYAEKALEVFKQLRILDAPNSPTFGECCAPWVFEIVKSVFGAYDEVNGRRLITEWFILVPKKNSKSTLAAGIMMTAHILNWRQSAEFAILAPTVEIANNSFAPAKDMCSERAAALDEEELGLDPAYSLNTLTHVQTHVKTITHRNTGAVLKVVAADSNTVGGKKSVGTLVDELWLFGKQPNAENMLREATGGLASRPEGFVIYLTTQSDDPPAGVFAQKLKYARDVRDGKLKDPRFVPILYEFPEEMILKGDHRKPENFGLVNPNLNYSVDREFLEREFAKAQNDGEVSMLGFLSKHLNVQIGIALQNDRWLGADHWGKNAVPLGLTLPEILERSDVVTVGIDGGGLDDLLGLSVIGRDKETQDWLVWAHAWAHPSVLERRKSEASKFQDFARAGELTLVESVGDDVNDVADIVKECEESGLLDKIGVDQAGIGAIVDAIVNRGIEFDRIVGIPQGWKLVGAIKTAERKLAAGSMKHGGTALMSYSVGNAKVEPRGNAILITKQAAGNAKIDPLMAMFDAVYLMSMNPQPRAKKYQMMIMGA